MSNIDAQIKALQLKKKKIDYLTYVTDLVKNDTKCIDFKEVKDEVVKKILPFLKELAAAIEQDIEVKPKTDELAFSQDESKALKAIAAKILNKTEPVPPSQNGAFSQETPSQVPQAQASVQAKKQAEGLSTSDKMNFAMNNRHLADKRVQVMNDQNAQIFGKVVGLDAPYVIVKTETGPTISVPIEKVVPA